MRTIIKYLATNLPIVKKYGIEIYDRFDHCNKKSQLAHKFYEYYFRNRDLDDLNDEEFLQYLEIKFGGYITDVEATIGDESVIQLDKGKHTGGDRMNVFFHDYSRYYSKYLNRIRNKKIVLVEVGILRGTGLAIWESYFSQLTLYGLDYDLGNVRNNMDYLKKCGAFSKAEPKLIFYDQFANNYRQLKQEFNELKLDVIIDDAFHSDKTAISTFKELMPYFAEEFVYFIEDNKTAYLKLRKEFPNYSYDYNGNELTVITPRKD
jgi:hypothetical protein